MPISALRTTHPRLYHAVDDPDFAFAPPADAERQQILDRILADCKVYSQRRPWKKMPERFDSPHPYHQLYITFYSGMHASALIEHYAFAWRLSGDERWLQRAKQWLLSAAAWEHSDRVEEHFYTANRYMQAFALALDLLADQLTAREEDRITDCLLAMMQRWWPEVEEGRRNASGGHHAVVDNGHFGVAALHLLGKCSEAPRWVEAVIERFRCAIMPHGCGPDGEPVDGASFWPWENLWLLHFADALRNVTGIDLGAEFAPRLARPLKWFRYQLVSPDSALGAGRRAVWSPTLLRLAQDAGDGELRRVALADPDLGRIYRFMVGAKGSTAECIIAYGPYAYMYCDPAFDEKSTRSMLPPSRKFTAHYGDSALLRSSWEGDALSAQVSGYGGGVAHNFSDLHLQWAGQALLQSISSEEVQPVSCGSLPCVGGQNEIVAHLGALERTASRDRLRVRSRRLDQEYWLLRGETPVLLVALRRRPRGVKCMRDSDSTLARLDGRDYLQYPREPHFNPDGGEVRLRLRLRGAPDMARTQVLFNTGIGTGAVGGPGPQVNNYTLGLDEEGLFFRVQSQRGHSVSVRLDENLERLKAGKWCQVAAAWGGFNEPKGRPFIEVEVDGVRQRCDDPALFGEVGVDSQRLRSRSTPRTFYIKSNTLLAFGGAVQMAETETRCDIAGIDLSCPQRQPLQLDFADGLGAETGSAPPQWKLNALDLRALSSGRARLGAGKQVVEVLPVLPQKVSFCREVVPFAPSGLAAGSLRRLGPAAEEDATRLLVQADEGDLLVLAFAPARAGVRLERRDDGFALRTRASHFSFSLGGRSRAILTPENPA